MVIRFIIFVCFSNKVSLFNPQDVVQKYFYYCLYIFPCYKIKKWTEKKELIWINDLFDKMKIDRSNINKIAETYISKI